MLGRAANEDEWRSALLIEDNEYSRLLWMESLFRIQAPPGVRLLPEISQRLRLYRLGSTASGRLFLRSLERLRRWLLWRLFERIGRRIAGLTRYTYRHTRKWRIRTGKKVREAARQAPRKAPPDLVANLCAEEREIFERLLRACNVSADRVDAGRS